MTGQVVISGSRIVLKVSTQIWCLSSLLSNRATIGPVSRAIIMLLSQHFPEDFLSPHGQIPSAAAFLADKVLGKFVGAFPLPYNNSRAIVFDGFLHHSAFRLVSNAGGFYKQFLSLFIQPYTDRHCFLP